MTDTKEALERLDKVAREIATRKAFLEKYAPGQEPEKPALVVKDPIEEYNEYFGKWFQQLAPFRTNCFRCGVDSPIVHNRVGTLAFGDTKQIRRGDTDITNDVITAFERIGWKFQKRRSYCPTCKKLGSI
jgi:hypothetical protein